MTPFNWAIVGPGQIAHRFAQAVQDLPNAQLRWVHGRNTARAQAFARHWSRDGAAPVGVAGALADVLGDRQIDGVYIATPHALHGDTIAQCLLAGKAVLCEKPLVPTRAEAQQLVSLAQQQQVFLMEAVWTRFLPIYQHVGRWLAEQAIGRVVGIQSSFCFAAPFEPTGRLFDPSLAGGALLDVGMYNLSMTRWVLQQALGACPEPLTIQASGRLAPTGVDQRVAATLSFADGVSSQFICAMDCSADNGLRIFGERGVISLPHNFWEATEAVLQVNGQAAQRQHAPFRINGFEEEIEAAQQCIRSGQIECQHITHADTLATLGWMDQIRRMLGVCYPFEPVLD